jgi:hypothetical protein
MPVKNRSVQSAVTLLARHQATKISEVCASPLDILPLFVTPQFPPILQWRSLEVGAMQTNQVDPTCRQALVQCVRVTGFDRDEPCRVLAERPRPCRGTAIVSGVASINIIVAGAHLPSAKVSDQYNWPWASSWPRKGRHALRHTSCSVQSRRRRQHALDEGYRLGPSFQRAPVRNIHRIPSQQGRWEAVWTTPRRGPGSGISGCILFSKSRENKKLLNKALTWTKLYTLCRHFCL